MTAPVTYPTDVGNAHVIDWAMFLEVKKMADDYAANPGLRVRQEGLIIFIQPREDWSCYDGELL
jgi:hypothetical protein